MSNLSAFGCLFFWREGGGFVVQGFVIKSFRVQGFRVQGFRVQGLRVQELRVRDCLDTASTIIG